jgi:hypothetical protein
MINRAITKIPQDSLAIPPGELPATRKAQASFQSIAAEGNAARAAIKEHVAASAADVAAATNEAARARIDGKEPPRDPATVRAQHEQEASDLLERAETLSLAVDLAGNSLVDAIVKDRPKWLEALAPKIEESEQAYAAYITAARKELATLGGLRGAAVWLQDFHSDRAKQGQANGFPGGRCDVQIERGELRAFDSSVNPDSLLQIAARVQS